MNRKFISAHQWWYYANRIPGMGDYYSRIALHLLRTPWA